MEGLKFYDTGLRRSIGCSKHGLSSTTLVDLNPFVSKSISGWLYEV